MKPILIAGLVLFSSASAFAQRGLHWRTAGDVPAENCNVIVYNGQVCTRPGYQCLNGNQIWGCDWFGRTAYTYYKGEVPYYQCNYNVYDGAPCRANGERCLDGNWIMVCGR